MEPFWDKNCEGEGMNSWPWRFQDFYCAENSLRERQLGHTCALDFWNDESKIQEGKLTWFNPMARGPSLSKLPPPMLKAGAQETPALSDLLLSRIFACFGWNNAFQNRLENFTTSGFSWVKKTLEDPRRGWLHQRVEGLFPMFWHHWSLEASWPWF